MIDLRFVDAQMQRAAAHLNTAAEILLRGAPNAHHTRRADQRARLIEAWLAEVRAILTP